MRKKNLQFIAFLVLATIKLDAQTCNNFSAPTLIFKNPVYILGTGTGEGTVDAKYRFSNVTNANTSTTDVIVTLQQISNASLTSLDDDDSNPGTADNFQPVVTVDPNSNGFIKFNFLFVQAGTSTPFTQTCINFTALDIDGGSDLQEEVTIYDATTILISAISNLTPTLGNPVSQITANNVGCGGICTNVENVANFGKINSDVVVFTFGVNNSGASSAERYGSFQFSPYNFPLIVDVLPLRLNSIIAARLSNGYQISWSTSQESNLKQFVLERSENGIDFSDIKIVLASNFSNGSNYSIIDKQVTLMKQYFYRIKSIDYEGKIIYSPVVKVQSKVSLSDRLQIFPSPVKTNASISFTVLKNTIYSIAIFDNVGRSQQNYLLPVVKGLNTVPLKNIENLASGTYHIKVSSADGFQAITSFVKF